VSASDRQANNIALPIQVLRFRSGTLVSLLPVVVLLVVSVLFFVYLLSRFPFDGLYGQDSYAYYFQSVEFWHKLTGQPVPPWPFAGEGFFHWPVGYHLQLIFGFLFGGETPIGGRAITLAMAAATPLLVYVLAHEVWTDATTFWKALAGVVAGGALLLMGVYARSGVVLMADTPALFWTLLAMVLMLRAFPPNGHAAGRRVSLWAFGAGFSLGMAVLLRLGSVLVLLPLALYLIARRFYLARSGTQPARRRELLLLLVAVVGLAVAQLPQLLYIWLYRGQPVDPGWLSGWSLANLFAKTVRSPDGISTFDHTMVAFYFVDPLGDLNAGFLSSLYLPALLLGLALLIRSPSWPVLALLGSWWFVPALFLSGSPYQTHRFVLSYVVPAVLLVGIGFSRAVRLAYDALSQPAIMGWWGTIGLCLLITGAALVGGVQSVQAARGQLATLASIEDQEIEAVRLVRQAVPPGPATPHVVSFALSMAVYYYTNWSVLDFSNHDTLEIQAFLQGDMPAAIVLPEASMSTQWAGTPLAARWDWIKAHYQLHLVGLSGPYSIYAVVGLR
jgi:4-amino-4-deoxy-L-arabinose transferase-like glycosyltransferase